MWYNTNSGMKMPLSRAQVDAVSKYLADISKLIFVAAVLGFFVPMNAYPVPLTTFVLGFVTTLVTFGFSVYLIK